MLVTFLISLVTFAFLLVICNDQAERLEMKINENLASKMLLVTGMHPKISISNSVFFFTIIYILYTLIS